MIIPGESTLQAKIDHGDFIVLHKGELKAAIIDNETFRKSSVVLDKIGVLLLGIVFNSFFNEIFSVFMQKHKLTLLMGVLLTSLGFYFSYQKEKKIKEILEKKLKEAEATSTPPVSPL